MGRRDGAKCLQQDGLPLVLESDATSVITVSPGRMPIAARVDSMSDGEHFSG